MVAVKRSVPIIDIFAGPGGLGEGFSQYKSSKKDRYIFDNLLSIEKDEIACQTLRLRKFFHMFRGSNVPREYYRHIRGETSLDEIVAHPKWQQAQDRVWNIELGKIDERTLHRRIKTALSGEKNWVLLGGPPCQAYSLIGRARMTGIGPTLRNGDNADRMRAQRADAFLKDARHTLYKEYLRIVAVHQPAVFVMENVKGILSSTVMGERNLRERVFQHIKADLAAPRLSLRGDQALAELISGKNHTYRIYSFVTGSEVNAEGDSDFLIRCENYGVPQSRHRVVLLGVRDDIAVGPSALAIQPIVTVRDVIGDMPRLRSGLSKEEDNAQSWKRALNESFPARLVRSVGDESVRAAIRKVLSAVSTRLSRGSHFMRGAAPEVFRNSKLEEWLIDKKIKGVIQHQTRAHMISDLGRYLFAAAETAIHKRSPKLELWPKELLPQHRNVTNRTRAEAKEKYAFTDRFKVQSWDKPSSTVTSHIAKDGHYFIHPDPAQVRSLTVREAARLQTFPDNYYFCGNRTQQFHQVGNAVPPFLAVQLAEIVDKLLSGVGRASRTQFELRLNG